jgi:tetratricopeptide (TPR) repeat protein
LAAGLLLAPPAHASPQAADLAYEQALIMLKKGRAAQAQEALERTVLLNPQHAGAWLDLALVSAQLGDYRAALGYARRVLQFDAPPAAARAAAERLIDQLQTPQRHHAGGLALDAGHTSNANGGARIDEIGLTTDYGRLYFALAENARAAPAWFTRLSGYYQTRLVSPLGGGPLYSVGASLKQFSANQPLEYQLLGQLSQQSNRWHLGARAALARPGEQLDYARAGGWLEYATSAKTVLGASIDHYHHWQLHRLNKTSASLHALWQPAPATQLKLTLGRDFNRTDRAGGDQLRLALSAFRLWQLPQGRLTARLDLEWVEDSEGYSPLLEYNASRTLKRNTLEVNYSLPLSSDLTLNTGFSGWDQRSNIDLFRSHGLSVQAGLDWTF